MKLEATRTLSVARYVYDEESRVSGHSHNFYHVLVVTGGRGALAVGEEHCEAVRGEAYFIPPGVRHAIDSDDALPLRTLEWKFYVDDAPTDERLGCIPLRFRTRGTGVKEALETMVDEAIARRTLYKEAIAVRSAWLLLELVRMHEADGRRSAPGPADVTGRDDGVAGDGDPAAIAAYIEARYAEPLTIAQLAAAFHTSSTRLSASFRKAFGRSPLQYAGELRLKRAKELLLATDWSVTAIAERTGFASVHYMSRLFSRKERLSPLAYRQLAKRPRHIRVEERYRIEDHMAVKEPT
ncbi:helix-turn-helix domain-containing protein [Paenibacillus sp. GYB003]|uniref:helix-turn-helix domain-containing protein n=1 Tax=Paenibacillus sp. GYB003 TaxID=2994392 RepID=UPI002F9627CB